MGIDDSTEAVTWLLAALEAAIVALAESRAIETPTQHWKKAEVATRLYADGVLPTDVAAELDRLNDARKVAIYEGEEPELGGRSLQELAAEIEPVVELAEREADR